MVEGMRPRRTSDVEHFGEAAGGGQVDFAGRGALAFHIVDVAAGGEAFAATREDNDAHAGIFSEAEKGL